MPDPTVPSTQYAHCAGGVRIAWQALGQGERDVLFIPGGVSHVEANRGFPEIAAFLARLAVLGRLLVFDKRGTGLSDRVARMPTMAERMEDVRAVLEAAHARQTVIVAASEGCALAALFAATHRERCAGLVLYGGHARRAPAPDYPWAPTAAQRQALLDAVLADWGGPMVLSTLAPSRALDAAFGERFAAYLRASASPDAAHALARMNTGVDIRAALPRIRVPTLVLHRLGDRTAHADEGRYLARHIPGAAFEALPGEDPWCFVGEIEPLLRAIEAFVAGLPPPQPVAPPGTLPRRVPESAGTDPVAALTPRQREVLELIAKGRTNKQIATALSVRLNTVHRHVGEVLARLGVPTRGAAAAAFAERQRLR